MLLYTFSGLVFVFALDHMNLYVPDREWNFWRDVVFKRIGHTVVPPSTIEIPTKNEKKIEENPQNVPRRSCRPNIGIPPNRFGYDNVQCKYMDWMTEYSNKSKEGKRDSEDKIESINSLTEIPTSYNEAITHPLKEYWIKAMVQEISSIHQNNTWVLADLPDNRKAIGCKWIFTIKNNEKGVPVRFKARLVAQDYSQKFGLDYNQVFAPVAKQSTLRILLSITSKASYHTRHLDINKIMFL